MEETKKTIKKNQLWLILSWIFGVFFTLMGLFSIISDTLQAIVLLVMAAVLLPPVLKFMDEKWKIKVSKWAKIIIIIIGLILIGALSDSEDIIKKDFINTEQTEQISQNNINEVAVSKDSQENIDDQNVGVEIKKGINLSRNEIISVFEKPALGFKFEEGAPVDGLENYVANKGAAVIQLLGPADNLAEVSIIALLSNDAGENMLTLATVIGFANVIDESSIEWISDEFGKVADNVSKQYDNSKVFNGRLFKVNFTPTDFFNSFSLVVTPAK